MKKKEEVKKHEDTEKEEYIIDEEKFDKNVTLRQDNELFDDASYIKHPVLAVKRVQYNTAEDWELNEILTENNKSVSKTVLVIKGVRFTAKEKEYFRTIDGVKYLIQGYKSGWRTVSDFKKNLKAKNDSLRRNKKSK